MKSNRLNLIIVSALLAGCYPPEAAMPPRIPAEDYAHRVRIGRGERFHASPPQMNAANGMPEVGYGDYGDTRAQLRMVSDPPEDGINYINAQESGTVSNLNGLSPDVEIIESTQGYTRDYNGPLSLGDPGTSNSLWQESRRGNDIFRDERAWQPMDLITILVEEESEGTKEAETETEQESNVLAAINNFLGYEADILESNPNINLASLINAATTNEYDGSGETTRKDELTATISAMIVEVLPGGVLRLEGEKIIAVNQEEQTIKISGLVRPRDVNSANEVKSSKIANMRVDYYGNGIVDETQHGGWLRRIIGRWWPF